MWLRLAYQGEYVTLLPDHAALSADSVSDCRNCFPIAGDEQVIFYLFQLLLTAGVMGFVITFFGCCGSWFQSKCLLICVSIAEAASTLTSV